MGLSQISRDVVEPFGIQVEFDASPGATFEKIEYEPGTKLLEFLKKLAEQRGLLFTNNEYGNLKFWKPQIEKVSATFKEGELPYISCRPTFAAQGMYSHITGFTKTDKTTDASSYTYENNYLLKAGVFRPLSFTVKASDDVSLEYSVIAQSGRM